MINRWKDIQPTDEYRVQLNGLIHEADRELLLFLYQPLVGMDAISLYSYFWAEADHHALESETALHSSLAAMLSQGPDAIFEARIRLEAIGLLRTYIKGHEPREFIYQLQRPLTADRFFEDPMLSVFLYRQIGSRQFQRMKERFLTPFESTEHLREVTRSFQDVFTSEAMTSQSMPSNDLPDGQTLHYTAESSGIRPELDSFDFQLFQAGLSERLVPKKLLTYRLKELIAKLAHLYGLTALDMQKVLLSAVNDRDEVEEEELRKAARDFYQLHRNPVLPKMKPLTEKTEVPAADSDDDVKRYLGNASPVQVLKDASGGSEPAKSELELIDTLLYKQKLPQPVVNVLLQYVLLRNDMKLTKDFTEKIGIHWARKNVSSVEEAMNLAITEHRKYLEWKTETNNGSKPKRSQKTIRKEKLPDWFKNRKQEKVEETPAAEVSSDESFEERKQKLQERLRNRKTGQVNQNGEN